MTAPKRGGAPERPHVRGRTERVSGGKKRYAKPTLTDYGSVSKLTRGAGGSTLDNPTKMQACL